MKRRAAQPRKRLFKNQRAKLGLPPGTPVYVGDRPQVRPRVTLIDYDEKHYTEQTIDQVAECLPFREADTVTWVNVDGLNDVALLQELGKVMGYHALTLEDILNTEQRPKAEDYGDYLYITLKTLEVRAEDEQLATEHVSLVLGRNYVISLQEIAGDPFDPVRARIRTGVGRIRRYGSDYLAYALLDLVVDSYFSAIDHVAERIEALDAALATGKAADTLQKLSALKRQVLQLRRAIAPVREVVATLRGSESELIHDSTEPYLRDLYDHVLTVTERIETCRDLLAGIQELYFGVLSNRTNTVMRIIAVFSSVFLPLTFITGIFGMNFEFMPLIHKPWGFALSTLLMLAVVAAMLWYFRRRHWL